MFKNTVPVYVIFFRFAISCHEMILISKHNLLNYAIYYKKLSYLIWYKLKLEVESLVGLAQHYKGWSLTINPRKQQNNLHKKRVRT